ncbi:MAG: NAD-dependent epimerase/dehydratase family protein [Pseudomonadota bacterium]
MSSSGNAIVFGAGGFIGSHLVERLKAEGFWVRGVDLKRPEFSPTAADDFVIADLRNASNLEACFDRTFDEIYQLAAEMGGAGYIFTGENDFDIFASSAAINLNTARVCANQKFGSLYFASSACVYNHHKQASVDDYTCVESSAYPAEPDSEYGWEKLFAERLFQTLGRDLKARVRVGRYHNIFGPLGTWDGGREKAPAAICRKVVQAADKTAIEIWGDGKQVRSFLYIDECIEGTVRLMRSDVDEVVNIGSDEPVSINELAEMAIEISGKTLTLNHVAGPQGVRARSSDNRLIEARLGWRPSRPLKEGIAKTYAWVESQVQAARS